MATIRLKPAPGRMLRNHQRDYRIVPPEGEEFADDFVVQKRLADGDAVLAGASGADPAPAQAPPQAPPKSKK